MKKLSAIEFEELIIEEEQKAAVLFSRKTCHVCQAVHPLIEEMEQDYPGIKFYSVDVEEESNLFMKYGGKGVPQLITFCHGEIVDRLAGQHEEDEYAEQIEKIINK